MATHVDVCGFCFIKPVFGFCENCSLRLCDTCFTVHTKASGHITFSLDKTLSDTVATVVRKSDIHEQKCSSHTTENLSFYCEYHDTPICGRCMRLNHSSCLKSVIDLHDISFNEQLTNERLSHFDELKEEIQVIEGSITENIKTVDDLKETYMNAIKAYRKRLDDRLNMLQSKIESAGKSKCDANVERLQNIADKCKETYARIDKKRNLIEELLRYKHERNLFIISKGLYKEITEIKGVVRQAKLDNHVVQFGFVENSSLDRTLLNDIHEFGTLQETCDGSEMETETTLEVENNVQESKKMAEGEQSVIPNIEEQKDFVATQLDRQLIKGEIWYMLDVKWYKQWKSYVGFETRDHFNVGEDSANPGHIDNSPLFEDDANTKLKEHLIDTLDYILIPAEGWDRLLTWYSMAEGQEPLPRKVIEEGVYSKARKVEVYPWHLKVAENSTPDNTVLMQFSRVDTIEQLEVAMRREFNINKGKEVRLWNRYMTNMYEPLDKKETTLQDAYLYSGQIVVIEQKNDDGTWPRAKPVPVNKNTFTSSSSNSSSKPSS
ncbi:uncharacterized protein LOC127842801 isoform X2 [Dreissena polymorpha]|uniref:uncharacterized protein LOC127842801 isoform X2 n=1 Tax=Dreissena polymorpha TaxID=45954 RepID=UPI002264D8A1|nr:uncharacterized protein LOC127842801 isoform X2 [Dreissena polymorpha]